MATNKIGGEEIFTASLEILYSKNSTHEEKYNKLEQIEPAASREIVNVRLQATSLEKLQEKLAAYVELAEL